MRLMPLAALVFTGLIASPPARAEAVIVNRIVAVVGGAPITLHALRRRARPQLVVLDRKQLPAWRAAEEARQILQKTLEEAIEEALIDRAARAAGLDVSDEELRALIDRLAAGRKETRAQHLAMWFEHGYVEADVRDYLRREVLEARVIQRAYREERGAEYPSGSDERTLRLRGDFRAAWLAAQRRAIGVERRLTAAEGGAP